MQKDYTVAQLKHLYGLAQEIRGPILEQAIAIELLVTDIISRHFCPDDARGLELFSLVLSCTDLTFRSKTEMLDKLLRLRYPDLVKKYPKLVGEINKVRRFRNNIAHRMLDTTEPWLSKKHADRIRLHFWKDGCRKQQVITKEIRDELLRKCSGVILQLLEIQHEVKSRSVASA